MREYLKHVSSERARFRHPALAREQNRLAAMESLQKMPGIAGIKPGLESILVFIEPEADLEKICQTLEEAVPQLKSAPQAMAACQSASAARAKRSFRKDILKTYLASGIATLSFAALGMHRWHILCGCVFTLFAIDHVWVRRKAL